MDAPLVKPILSFPPWLLNMMERGLAKQDAYKPENVIVLSRSEALKLMGRGWRVNVSLTNPMSAVWFTDPEGSNTPLKCDFAVRRWMDESGYLVGETKDGKIMSFGLSKIGHSAARKEEEIDEEIRRKVAERRRLEDEKLVTENAIPKPRYANVAHERQPKAGLPEWWPKTFAVWRKSDVKGISGTGFVIYGVMFSGGKCVIFWTATGAITTFDSFQQFESTHLRGGKTHGEAKILWFDEKERAPAEMLLLKKKEKEAPKPKTELKACFYCHNGYKTFVQGKKAWRNVCRSKDCRKRYASDRKTKKECAEAGIPVEGL